MEIDQPIKQRIVGALVITALAAIFIPMLFDDPVELSAQAISELDIPPSPEKNILSSAKPVATSAEKVLALPEPKTTLNKTNEPVESSAKQHVPAQSLTLSRWLIQVGSFSLQDNALALRDKLRKQGFTAFSEAYEPRQGHTMYRVRVGPELDKQRAAAMKKKLEQRNQVKTILLKE